MDKKRGVVYVAYGERARAQAQESIASVRVHAPSLAVAVVSDTALLGADIQIQQADVDKGARALKTRMYELSPFAETLYLDADTVLLASPDAGYKLLGAVDVVMAQDVVRNFADQRWPHLVAAEKAATLAEIGSAHHMYFNSGVVFFGRSPRLKTFMRAWHEEWSRWRQHDQMALLRALHRSPVRIAPIREVWNTHVRSRAVLVHHKHRQARRQGSPQ